MRSKDNYINKEIFQLTSCAVGLKAEDNISCKLSVPLFYIFVFCNFLLFILIIICQQVDVHKYPTRFSNTRKSFLPQTTLCVCVTLIEFVAHSCGLPEQQAISSQSFATLCCIHFSHSLYCLLVHAIVYKDYFYNRHVKQRNYPYISGKKKKTLSFVK